MIALPLFAFAPMVMTGAPRSATMGPVRTFNTAGPVRAHRHYQIAPLSRIDLEDVLGLIRGATVSARSPRPPSWRHRSG